MTGQADGTSKADAADLAWRFDYRAPDAGTREIHEAWRAGCRALAQQAVLLVPHGRERSLAMTAIEEALMWGNAGIARNLSPRQ